MSKTTTLGTQPRSDRASLVMFAAQVILAFVACELAFAIVDGPASGPHLAAVLILTTVFSVVALGFGAARPATGFGLDSRDLAAVVVRRRCRRSRQEPCSGLVLPRAVGLELGTVLIAALIIILFNLVFRLAQLELERMRNERRPNTQRTIVVGSGKAAASLVRLIQENNNFNYAVVGCVDDEILAERVGGKAHFR